MCSENCHSFSGQTMADIAQVLWRMYNSFNLGGNTAWNENLGEKKTGHDKTDRISIGKMLHR